MEFPLSGILNGSAVIAEGATFKDVRMLVRSHLAQSVFCLRFMAGPALTDCLCPQRVDHLSAATPQSTLRWGHAWDGGGQKCSDRCGTPAWATMSAALGSFSAVCYLTGRDVCESSRNALPAPPKKKEVFDRNSLPAPPAPRPPPPAPPPPAKTNSERHSLRCTDQGLGGKVPIGLVESAWGGTRIEAWTSPEGLAKCPGEGTAKCGPCCDAGDLWCKAHAPGSAPFCGRMNSTNSGNQGETDTGVQGARLNPMGLFLRTPTPFIWSIRSAFPPP
jgi:hypothetical protein